VKTLLGNQTFITHWKLHKITTSQHHKTNSSNQRDFTVKSGHEDKLLTKAPSDKITQTYQQPVEFYISSGGDITVIPETLLSDMFYCGSWKSQKKLITYEIPDRRYFIELVEEEMYVLC
jgi:hypothetical protein